jgi:hypothetical protein
MRSFSVLVVLEPRRRARGPDIDSLEWIADDMQVTAELADPALEGYIFHDTDSPAEEDEAARGYTAVKAYEKVRKPA